MNIRMFVAGLCGGLLLGVISVQSRPTGAPLTACPLIAPIGHVNTTRHPNNGSYGLSTDVFTGGVYVPGKNYTRKHIRADVHAYACGHASLIFFPSSVTLKGTDVFKGLLVQARLVADQTTPVGSFTPGGVVKLSACTIASVSRTRVYEAHVYMYIAEHCLINPTLHACFCRHAFIFK